LVVTAEALGLAVDIVNDGGERRWFLRRDQRRHPHRAGRERRDQPLRIRQAPFRANNLR
jgi:hypothetical protein